MGRKPSREVTGSAGMIWQPSQGLRPHSSETRPPSGGHLERLPSPQSPERRHLSNLEAKLVHRSSVPASRQGQVLSNGSSSGMMSAPDPPLLRLDAADAPFRTEEERASGPDRLNLDCRGLEECAHLVGEERLRLLNYQNNQITGISNLHNLRCLVFLDLYNNQIERIENLEHLSKLRVLMIGKNKISKVENLDKLSSLEVLDLHSNSISRIEGLGNLSELRVLNLAGNCITEVSQLGGHLAVLAEINLRHNQITHATDQVLSLQRLFLSNNAITSLTSIESLLSSPSIVELCLDSNPVADEPLFRPLVLDKLASLRHLDLKRVTAEERRSAQGLLRREDERLATIARQNQVQSQCDAAIAEVARSWAERSGETAPCPGFSMVEGFKLSLYGSASDELVSAYPHCTQVSMVYIGYQELVAGHLGKTHARSNVSSVALTFNEIESLDQLWHCCAFLSKVSELRISDNKVCDSELFRPFVIFALPQMTVLNQQPVTPEEQIRAKQLFSPLGALRAAATKWSGKRSDQGVAAGVVAGLTREATQVSAKLQQLHAVWPEVVLEHVVELISKIENDEQGYAENIIKQLRLEERKALLEGD